MWTLLLSGYSQYPILNRLFNGFHRISKCHYVTFRTVKNFLLCESPANTERGVHNLANALLFGQLCSVEISSGVWSKFQQ